MFHTRDCVRQNFFFWQIQVIVSHLIDEVFRRACFINNFFKVPRSDCLVRISSKPSKITIATSQWSNVIRIRKVKIFSIFSLFPSEMDNVLLADGEWHSFLEDEFDEE